MSKVRYLGFLRVTDYTSPVEYYRVYSRRDRYGQRAQRHMTPCGHGKTPPKIRPPRYGKPAKK